MNILYRLAYGIWFLLSLLPLRVLYIISDVFYFLLAKVVRYRHRVIEKNVRESFPSLSDIERREIIGNFYAWLCDYFVETLKLMTMSQREMMRRMKFKGTEQVNQILSEGQSVGVYLGHYGQWEWITSLPYWITAKGQCTQLYHPLENKLFDKLFCEVREKRNAKCIPMSESLRKMAQFRAQGMPIVVGYISDQVPFWNNIHHWLDFLHHDTPVITGTERIMKATHQAVFYGDVRRIRRGYYTCEFQLITREPKAFPDFKLTDTYFHLLEESIHRDPSLYLWSHNRWKRTHEEFNIRYDAETGRVDLRDLDVIRAERQTEEKATYWSANQ
ncbi:MAG: lysophospholipid acyltransferase family protein [Bacteroidota bacterium]|nr:lysophospholipid acyltransferase family protein [Bacteroidota bacterium]